MPQEINMQAAANHAGELCNELEAVWKMMLESGQDDPDALRTTYGHISGVHERCRQLYHDTYKGKDIPIISG